MGDSYNHVDSTLPHFDETAFRCGKEYLEVMQTDREDEGEAKFDATIGSVWYTVYMIKKGEHVGKTVLAFMGTNNLVGQSLWPSGWLSIQLSQDKAMIRAGPPIVAAITAARRVMDQVSPNFVTGHSLGGFLAEVVFSYPNTAEKGVSFGAPGAWSSNNRNLLNPNRADFHGKLFNVVLNKGDSIGRSIGAFRGSQFSHIAGPSHVIWVSFGWSLIPTNAHSTVGYARTKRGSTSCQGDWLRCSGENIRYSDGLLTC